MKAIVVAEQGTPVAANVSLREDWDPLLETKPGEVVVRTLASAFNHMDLWVGRGVPGLDLEYPRVSGCDGCGIVEAVGPGVDPAWIDRQVIYNAAIEIERPIAPDEPTRADLSPEYELIGEHHFGAHAERFVCPADNLAVVDGTDPLEAAAFGLCALTAYSMMMTKGGLQPGQTVLIPGIGGGVATSALAIARYLGCPACVTSRHQWKLDAARELGAQLCILDEGQDWSKEVRGWTERRGVNMAVDSVGKATHLSCIKSLARGGAYVTPGCTSGPNATTDLARIFWNQLRILGSTMGSNDEFHEVAALFRTGRLEPVIDRVYQPGECQQAYQRLEAGEQLGKIVIDWR
jgi:zinc-binding alcohol dehydrogenase/oxidoreductase